MNSWGIDVCTRYQRQPEPPSEPQEPPKEPGPIPAPPTAVEPVIRLSTATVWTWWCTEHPHDRLHLDDIRSLLRVGGWSTLEYRRLERALCNLVRGHFLFREQGSWYRVNEKMLPVGGQQPPVG